MEKLKRREMVGDILRIQNPLSILKTPNVYFFVDGGVDLILDKHSDVERYHSSVE
jgi:hypothetical protein